MLDTTLPSVSTGIITRMYHASIRFFAYHRTYTAFLFVVLTITSFYALFSTPKIEKETLVITTGRITQYVTASGQVQPSRDANLSFQTGGQVSFVGAKPGDFVTQGKVIATLSGGNAQTVLLQAQATLASAYAHLSQLQESVNKEELVIKEQELENTKNSLEQSYDALPDVIQNIDAATADVIKNKFGSLFVLTNGRYILSFSSCDKQLQSNAEQKRTTLENILADFQAKSSVITTMSGTKTIDATFEESYQSALATNELVNLVSNLLLVPCSMSNATLDSFRTTLSQAKSMMTTLFSDSTTQRTTLIASKNAYTKASRDLEFTKARTDPYKIRASSALVAQAESHVTTAQSELSKTIIRAPFSGVVTSVDLSLGKTVIIGKTVLNMIAKDSFEVEAKVLEIDSDKVKVGAMVDVTLDAYGKTVFPAMVTHIAPSAITEGVVPTYTVVVTFLGNDSRIKQGMNANAEIVIEHKSHVISVPARFIKVVSDKQGTVQLITSGQEITKDVTLGILGAGGLIEIKNGLMEGDSIVSPLSINSYSQKQNN